MRIRRLTPPDREKIASLLRSDSTFSEEEVTVALELVDSAILAPGRDYDALVCHEGGTVLGYVCFGRTPMTDATYDLYWIATHVRARGQGVATRLAEAMEEEIAAAGARTIRLETSAFEAYGAARAFYARREYVEVGRIPDFYRPGDDLIIFAKRLPAAIAARTLKRRSAM